MGSDRHYAEKAPVRRVAVVAFWMDRFRSQTNGSGGSPMRPATSPWPRRPPNPADYAAYEARPARPQGSTGVFVQPSASG